MQEMQEHYVEVHQEFVILQNIVVDHQHHVLQTAELELEQFVRLTLIQDIFVLHKHHTYNTQIDIVLQEIFQHVLARKVVGKNQALHKHRVQIYVILV